jgi:RNA-binding protein
VDLTRQQRRYLAREAHPLEPVVMVGREGVSAGLLEAVREALAHHELIKVRFQSFKEERDAISADIADSVDAALVRIIGNVAILFRQNDDPETRKIVLPR